MSVKSCCFSQPRLILTYRCKFLYLVSVRLQLHRDDSSDYILNYRIVVSFDGRLCQSPTRICTKMRKCLDTYCVLCRCLTYFRTHHFLAVLILGFTDHCKMIIDLATWDSSYCLVSPIRLYPTYHSRPHRFIYTPACL